MKTPLNFSLNLAVRFSEIQNEFSTWDKLKNLFEVPEAPFVLRVYWQNIKTKGKELRSMRSSSLLPSLRVVTQTGMYF